MHRTILEPSCSSTKEAQLGIGPEAAVSDPSSYKMISTLPSATSGCTLASARPRFASSLKVIMTTERFIGNEGLEIVSHDILSSRCASPRNFRQQEHDQDQQLRFDGMAVSGVRKYEV